MTRPRIVVDPGIAFGEPRIERSGAPVHAVVSRFIAGDSVAFLAVDYGCFTEEIEEALRFKLFTPRQREKYLAGLDPLRRVARA